MKETFKTSVGGYIVPTFLIALSVGFLVGAQQFDLQSRSMPLLVGRAMLLLAVLDFISRTQSAWGRTLTRLLNPGSPFDEIAKGRLGHRAPSPLSQVRYILWLAAFAIALVLFGISVAVPVFLFASLAWIGRRNLIESILITVGISGLIWVLFVTLLHLDLFPGILLGGQW